jgi:curli biogenesis system outer membrane secretion channel CsgG
MKRLTTLIVVATAATALSASAWAQTPPPATAQGPKKRAIVTAMEVKVQGVVTTAPTPSGDTTVVTLDIEQPTEFGTGLTDMLVTALVSSGRFLVMERQHLEEIERELALTGRSFGDDETTRLLPAQIIVRGSVTELKMRRSGTGLGGVLGDRVGFNQARAEASVALDLKIIEVETGRVLDSVKAEGKAISRRQSLTLSHDELKVGTASFDEGPLGGAVRAAIEDAVKKITERAEKVQWEARVIDVVEADEMEQIYLNFGQDAGLKVGDLLLVRRPGRVLIDPETQIVLGRSDGERIGMIRITELREKFSLAEHVERGQVQRGDVVRLPPKR